MQGTVTVVVGCGHAVPVSMREAGRREVLRGIACYACSPMQFASSEARAAYESAAVDGDGTYLVGDGLLTIAGKWARLRRFASAAAAAAYYGDLQRWAVAQPSLA